MATSFVLLALIPTILVVQGTNSAFRSQLNAPISNPESAQDLPQNYVESFITQRVDNFDLTNDATWQQRYLILGEFWAPGGCIFILLTGEWAVSAGRFENTMMYEMSRRLNCYMIQLEHRYYGQSRPTEDVSTENLKYLTVEQVLADTVVDHFQFKELAGAVYRHVGGNECYDRFERGFAAMEELVANGRTEQLGDMFHLCNGLDSTLDVQLFFSAITDFFSSVTQFERDTDVGSVCDTILSNETLTDAEALSLFVIEQLNGECLAIDYEQFIENDRQTNWDDPAVASGDRQWMYQLCTQLGWYHSSSSRFQPFGSSFPVELFFQICEDLFDEVYSRELIFENSARFNTVFGGVTPRTTNVLYIHGQLDPWRTIGVQSDINDSTTVIVIEGASQSNDIGPISDADSVAVAETKQTIMEVILSWIEVSRPLNK